MATQRTGTYGSYYGSTFHESEPLTQQEMNDNADYIYCYLIEKGWTVNAISALLGNMQAESSLNPGRWQSDDVGNYSGGYGLVQWTPVSKYTDWCAVEGDFTDPSEMDANLARIIYEVEHNIQWIATDAYNFSFLAFTRSTDSCESLAKAFLLNYERPADQSTSVQEYRASNAVAWYTLLTGNPPTPDTPKKTKRLSKLLLYSVIFD